MFRRCRVRKFTWERGLEYSHTALRVAGDELGMGLGCDELGHDQSPLDGLSCVSGAHPRVGRDLHPSLDYELFVVTQEQPDVDGLAEVGEPVAVLAPVLEPLGKTCSHRSDRGTRISSIGVGSDRASAMRLTMMPGQTRVRASTSTTGTIYGYDAMGRVVLMAECVPTNCGSGAFKLNYSYDCRPHASLEDRTPTEFASQCAASRALTET
jgi:hypothetical protein